MVRRSEKATTKVVASPGLASPEQRRTWGPEYYERPLILANAAPIDVVGADAFVAACGRAFGSERPLRGPLPDGADARGAAGVGSCSFIVRPIRLRVRSISRTFTFTMSPALTTSRGSLTNRSASWDTWTRPS